MLQHAFPQIGKRPGGRPPRHWRRPQGQINPCRRRLAHHATGLSLRTVPRCPGSGKYRHARDSMPFWLSVDAHPAARSAAIRKDGRNAATWGIVGLSRPVASISSSACASIPPGNWSPVFSQVVFWACKSSCFALLCRRQFRAIRSE